MQMYYIYIKQDIEANPNAPRVAKSCRDSLAAQAYAKKLSNAYDVVMLEVESDQFDPHNFSIAHMNTSPVYYGEGILDVIFYSKKTNIGRTPTRIRYHMPRGIFSTFYHNIGLLARLCLIGFIVYNFVDAIQANTITVAVPHGMNGSTSYDVSSGAKYVMTNVYNHGLTLYQYACAYASGHGITIQVH